MDLRCGGHRILVVDDNKIAAEMLRRLLELLENEVREAHSGEEAIYVAAEFRPQLVLMDIGMPGMNGITAVRKIREEPWSESMKLVALTGWGQEEFLRECREAGFDQCIVKPIDLAGLKAIVGSLSPKDCGSTGV
jgi:CheY-like chemotaxis protein